VDYMAKLKGFYKTNRNFVIMMAVSGVCLVIIIILAGIYFFSQTRGDIYGNRLNGIEQVPLTNDRLKEMEKTLAKEEIVDSVSINLKGRIVYINVFLNSGTGKDAQDIAKKAVEEFSDDEQAFYDMNFSFEKEGRDEESIFPIMGYKKSDNSVISWTNFSE